MRKTISVLNKEYCHLHRKCTYCLTLGRLLTTDFLSRTRPVSYDDATKSSDDQTIRSSRYQYDTQ